MRHHTSRTMPGPGDCYGGRRRYEDEPDDADECAPEPVDSIDRDITSRTRFWRHDGRIQSVQIAWGDEAHCRAMMLILAARLSLRGLQTFLIHGDDDNRFESRVDLLPGSHRRFSRVTDSMIVLETRATLREVRRIRRNNVQTFWKAA